MKRLGPSLDRADWSERWRAQADLLSAVHTAGPIDVVRVVDLFDGAGPHRRRQADTESSELYLLTEWTAGRRFDDWASDATVTRPERVAVVESLARTVGRLHQLGVIHRDLAPGNVIVSGDRAMIIDFGLAVRCSADESVHETEVIGTDDYRSSEASAGRWSHDSDRYALARLTHLALP